MMVTGDTRETASWRLLSLQHGAYVFAGAGHWPLVSVDEHAESTVSRPCVTIVGDGQARAEL